MRLSKLRLGSGEGLSEMRRTRRKTATPITEDLIQTMRVLRYAGQTVADIAMALKVSEATVSRYTREEVE
jgi:DNA-binding NarL/FixJ family response regulator